MKKCLSKKGKKETPQNQKRVPHFLDIHRSKTHYSKPGQAETWTPLGRQGKTSEPAVSLGSLVRSAPPLASCVPRPLAALGDERLRRAVPCALWPKGRRARSAESCADAAGAPPAMPRHSVPAGATTRAAGGAAVPSYVSATAEAPPVADSLKR